MLKAAITSLSTRPHIYRRHIGGSFVDNHIQDDKLLMVLKNVLGIVLQSTRDSSISLKMPFLDVDVRWFFSHMV